MIVTYLPIAVYAAVGWHFTDKAQFIIFRPMESVCELTLTNVENDQIAVCLVRNNSDTAEILGIRRRSAF